MDGKKRESEIQIDDENVAESKRVKLDEVSTNQVDPETSTPSQQKTVEDHDEFKLSDENAKTVGITEYLGSHEGFYGVIKERWEDFLVHEILPDGKVVHLDSLEIPSTQKEVPVEADNSKNDSSICLPAEILEEVQRFVAAGEETKLRLKASEDKEARSAFHAAIKQHFPTLDSSTEATATNREYVLTKGKSQRTQVKEANSRRPPKNVRNLFCHFVLYKEGRDTMNAIHLLSRMLGEHPGNITYAGTKDKRAITSQMCSVRGVDAQRLVTLNKGLRGMKLGNFQYHTEPIHLGQLQGNRFTLVIRQVTASHDVIEDSVRQWERCGFVNYFGTQRFGSSSTSSTHAIGAALLKKDWKAAIDLILTPTPEDLPVVRTFKKQFTDSGEVPADLASMPICLEKTLLFGVKQHAFTLNALQALPRQTLQLYVHSVQSFVWNRAVSKRIQQHGTRVLVGDLVMEESSSGAVKVLNEEEAASADITRVVLPLPGNEVRYPDNQQVSECYEEVLNSLGLSQTSFTSNVKEFHLSGAYRNVVVRPTDVRYEVRRYENVDERLVETDLDKLNQYKLPERTGSHEAVIIEMNLPKSTYATVAMRELMKTVRFHK